MQADMALWSYITQWLGYLSWCASAPDPACRPFAGFLALFGASAGTLSMLVLSLVGMLNSWEKEFAAARTSVAAQLRKQAGREKRRRAEPVLGRAASGGYGGHAGPLTPAAGALAMTGEPLRAAQPIAVPLQRAR